MKVDIPIATAAANVGDHKHCEACGKSIATDGRVCSPECKTRYEGAVRTRKRSLYIMLVLVALLVAYGLYGNRLLGG